MSKRVERNGEEQGFSLVSAIFLLVILSALGAAIANISTMQHASSAMDVQGARAYQAARAGIEWGLYRRNACSGTTSFVPLAPTMSGFTVTVTCTSYASGIVQIQSTACSQPAVGGNCPGIGGGANYIERQLQVTL